ncbi:MAG TPA: DUF952 domain-containing protein [Motilibacteraceae bacterium]|nr:DUF952 domain-containing protein [Motilibacteraceae bacterium]
MSTVFHVALVTDWLAAVAHGEYRTSTLGRTLDEEGFIHCSHPAQVGPTLDRFYDNVSEPLVLLTIDVDRLGVPLVEEEAPGAGELFPHVYGAIPATAVTAATPLRRGADGSWAPLPD